MIESLIEQGRQESFERARQKLFELGWHEGFVQGWQKGFEEGFEEGYKEAIDTIGEKLTLLATLVSGREDAAEILTNAAANLRQLDQIIIRYQ